MKNFLFIIAFISILTIGFSSCKTTEENYRAAYEIAANKTKKQVSDEDQAKINAEEKRFTAIVNGDSVRILRQYFNCVDISVDAVKRYSVIARGFKQIVNCKAMVARMKEEGLQNAGIIYVANDKTYYVIIDTFDTPEQAADLLKNVSTRVKMKLDPTKMWILNKI